MSLLSKIRFPSFDVQTALLFFLTVGFLVNSMALYFQRHYPPVITFNAATNLAELVAASRDETALRDLMLGGFRNATAIATGSWPFEVVKTGQLKVKSRILKQIFAAETARAIQRFRETIAVHQVYGTTELTFHAQDAKDVKVLHRDSGIYFEAFFNQTVPMGDNDKRIRTFHVRAFGQVAPATLDNPYHIKFSEFQIREIEPKTPRD